MSRLYCKEHGELREASVIEHLDEIKREGESVLFIKGKLTSGPWRCDSCNKILNEGNFACLVNSLTKEMTDEFEFYEFGYEFDYFDLDNDDEVIIHGREWPGA